MLSASETKWFWLLGVAFTQYAKCNAPIIHIFPPRESCVCFTHPLSLRIAAALRISRPALRSLASFLLTTRYFFGCKPLVLNSDSSSMRVNSTGPVLIYFSLLLGGAGVRLVIRCDTITKKPLILGKGLGKYRPHNLLCGGNRVFI